jgi:hypothetical protein
MSLGAFPEPVAVERLTRLLDDEPDAWLCQVAQLGRLLSLPRAITSSQVRFNDRAESEMKQPKIVA